MVKVVDIFAGPGGLAEGFSAFKPPDGLTPFQIALSIEKDRYAHQTLTLRSFFRQFEPEDVPDDYYDYLRDSGGTEAQRRKRLFDAWPRQAARAERAALLADHHPVVSPVRSANRPGSRAQKNQSTLEQTRAGETVMHGRRRQEWRLCYAF